MPTFVESCNCRGSRPRGIVGREHVPRPDAIARLLRDRSVARFVIAPTGFGKSSVAYEYAHLVFAFEHVFWMRGSSPCFLRDLDAGGIQEGIVSADPEVRLVVFDDVPHLDPDRSKRFRVLIDFLVERGCEAIVLSTPAADTFSMHELGSSVIRSRDLLLSDDELEALGNAPAEGLSRLPASARVPCLRWGKDGERTLLRGMREEALPIGMRASVLIMLVAGRGSLEEAFGHVPSTARIEAMELLGTDYCFLGMDERAGAFETAPIGIEAIARHLAGDLEAIAQACGHASSADLVSHLGEVVLRGGDAARACALMRGLASREACAAWIAEHGALLLASCALSEMAKLCGFARTRSKERRESLRFAQIVCLHLMGCAADRERILRGLASADLSDRGAIWMRGLLRFLCSDDACSQDAVSLLKQARSLAVAPEPLGGPFGSWAAIGPEAFVAAFGGPILADGASEAPGCFGDARAALVRSMMVLRYAELLGNGEHGDEPWEPERVQEGVRAVLRWMRTEEAAKAASSFPVAWHWARSLLERALLGEGALPEPPLEKDVLPAQELLRVRTEAERAAYERHLRDVEAKRVEFKLTHPDPFRKDEPSETAALSVRTAVPLLVIRLFGGMRVSIDGEPIEPSLLGARKVRMVLAILAINGGKEVSKEKMASLLWPEEGIAKYRRNFYNLWSKLKKALSVNGVCPYLIRTQSGCRLDTRYVSCDVDAFDEACRSMLFGSDELDDWERVYSRVSSDYSDDLMPGDYECDYINAVREQYRSQLVDGLISASRKLLARGIPDGALWFAREAMRRDDAREDGYLALMEAQIASDQRGYAIRTYLDCRRFLSEELGIDPSLKLVELYRSIIEAEEELV